MKNVLLTRHAETEIPETSLYHIFSKIEQIVGQNYTVIKPKDDPWSKKGMDKWLIEKAPETDLLITSIPYHLMILRTHGWKGRTIFEALGGLPRGGTNFRGTVPYLYKNDVIWCNSNADIEIYSLLVNQDSNAARAVCIPYGVDTEKFVPLKNTETREKLRSNIGASPDDFVILYAGRVTVEKNVHATIEAVAELTRLGYSVKLVIVGRIENNPFHEFQIHPVNIEQKIETLIDSLGISEKVVIQNWLSPNELNQMFNAADAFINLTLHHDENFGLSQVEAMSAGLPVIGTAWGGLKDTITQNDVGFFIDTWVTTNGIRFDAPAIIESLKTLIERRDLRGEKGSRGRKRAVEHYSDTLYSKRLTQLIENVFNRPVKETKTSFTPFGQQYHQRFTRVPYAPKYTKRSPAIPPVYNSFSDSDYMTLIAPYTSRTDHNLEQESLLFRAMTGHLKGDFFVSDDLLYSIRIPISSEERDVIKKLSRWRGVPRSALKHTDETLISLVQRGVIGISHISQGR